MASIGGLAVSQVANLIGTAYVGGRVSDLEIRVETINDESKRAVKKIEASVYTGQGHRPERPVR